MAITESKLSRWESSLLFKGLVLMGAAMIAVVCGVIIWAKLFSLLGLIFYAVAKVLRIFDVLFYRGYKIVGTIYLVLINLFLGGFSVYLIVDLANRYFGV